MTKGSPSILCINKYYTSNVQFQCTHFQWKDSPLPHRNICRRLCSLSSDCKFQGGCRNPLHCRSLYPSTGSWAPSGIQRIRGGLKSMICHVGWSKEHACHFQPHWTDMITYIIFNSWNLAIETKAPLPSGRFCRGKASQRLDGYNTPNNWLWSRWELAGHRFDAQG